MFGLSSFAETSFAALDWQINSINSGVFAVGQVGTVIPVILPALTGVSSVELVGDVGKTMVLSPLSGVTANGQTGMFGVTYWSLVDDAQDPNWQIIEMQV